MTKRAFTLTEALVALAIVATLLGLLVPALVAARSNANRKLVEAPELPSASTMKSFYLHTEQHDGHLWILNRTMDYFVHHPDCPCKGTLLEREGK